jgi:alpha-amylase
LPTRADLSPAPGASGAATEPLRFSFALHLHQPVGNFDSVFQQHLDDVYRPLLSALMSGECWPVAMHISGPLLEWLEHHAGDFVDEIGLYAAAGRLELLAAGHDEPILAVLSREDRIEQVVRHREWLRRRFGVDAVGLWLTERVWEPTIAEDLATAGVQFVLVDDRHFRVTGFTQDELHRHFMSESGGKVIRIFPIDEKLRYLVPFRPPVELAEYFRALRARGHSLAVLGDDGEKFGGWPGTRQWLYDEGWLDSFLGTMRELRDRGEVHLTRFDDAIRRTPSAGLAYLPTASYREMEGWSLPFEPARALLRLEEAWNGERLDGVEGGLLRGGHWRHFFVKYPESNRMHKMMLALSALCRERGDPEPVRRMIGQAQCNDAYWHGVFGGLYLPFLRGSVWYHLAKAEAALRINESLTAEVRDIDVDGHDEVWVHSSKISVVWAPARGGMIDLWLDLDRAENLLNVVARHREAYHEPLTGLDDGAPIEPAPGDDDAAGGAPSIHDLESQLIEIPPRDSAPRGLFVDRIVPAKTTRDDFIAGEVSSIRSWSTEVMSSSHQMTGDRIELVADADDLHKVISVGDDGVMRCRWQWPAARFPDGAWFATELSSSAEFTIDAPGAEQWEYPIETVAKSEKGFDRTVQGNAVVLRWPARAGEASLTLRAPT